MAKFNRKIVMIIFAIILIIILLFALSPLIIAMLSTKGVLASSSIEHFKENIKDYEAVIDLIQDDFEVMKDSENKAIVFADRELWYGDDIIKLNDDEWNRVKKIKEDAYYESIYVYDGLFVFGGVDGDVLSYVYSSKAPRFLKAYGERNYKLVKIIDNWYALVEIPKCK